MTRRMPSRSDSSRDLGDALDLLLAHQLADAARACAPCSTWYGISVTTICSRSPRAGDLLDLHARAHDDRAATGALRLLDAAAAVDEAAGGEVGARARSASGRRSGAAGCAMRWIVASTISPRLCGGMFVAMPTAMPPEPLTSRFGTRDGRTVGSVLRVVEVRDEVDGLLVDVGEELDRDLARGALRCSGRRRPDRRRPSRSCPGRR